LTKINDLGASCLYIGGGSASTVPPGATPAGASSYLDIAPSCALVASNGTGKLDCTKGSSTTAKECVNAGKCVGGASPGATCINDSDCFGPGTCTAGGNGTCTAGVCSGDGVTPCLSNADCGLCQDGISPCTTAADCPPVGACSGPNPHKTCLTDADCGGTAGACQPVENCLFGPPLAIQNPAVPSLATCVINVVATDASGTGDSTTGCASVNLPLQSRVYLTGNEGAPCPQCTSGTCSAGPNAGMPCTTNSTTGNPATEHTSQDCPPQMGGGLFNGALAVALNPLTTGSASKTNSTGVFCSGQTHAGAFGKPATRCIKETGVCAGNLTDGAPHSGAVQASVFCIPATANGTVNTVADLPGPGATSLPGTAQIVPTP